jgi:IPT/TIG domain
MRATNHVRKCLMLSMAMTFLLFISLGLGLLPAALAQPQAGGWVDVTPQQQSSYPFKIKAVNANVAWTYSHDTLSKTSDGGQTWQNQLPPEVNQGIVDLSIIDANNIWAVGYDTTGPVVLTTGNGGSTWTMNTTAKDSFATGSPFGIGGQLVAAVSAANMTTAWVAVNYMAPYGLGAVAIWKTEDEGASWILQASQVTPWYSLGSTAILKAIDTQNVWAQVNTWYFENTYGKYQSFIAKTSDGGATWAVSEPGGSVSAFSAVDAKTAWSGNRKTTDGGASWTNFDPGISVYSLDAVDANVVWVTGDLPLMPTSGLMGAAAKSLDGGQTWSIQPQIRWKNNSREAFDHPNYISAISATTAWASATGLIIRTTDGGGNLPVLSSVSPTNATWADQVTISGTGFGESRGNSYVLGITNPDDYVSWTDSQIMIKPTGLWGQVPLIVTTDTGSSNPLSLTVTPTISLTSITPNWWDTGGYAMVTIIGNGFTDSTQISLVSGQTVISANTIIPYSFTEIHCNFILKDAPVGAYDLVVSNGEGMTATLQGGFSVTAPTPCGFGSGLGVLALGLSLGLMSLAGGLLRRRKS